MRILKAHWPSLELFKGLGICLMLLIHGLVWLIPYQEFQKSGNAQLIRWLSGVLYLGFIPLLLPATAGSTLRLSLTHPLSLSPRTHLCSTLVLGGSLLSCGFLLNALSFPSDQILHWDVLQYLGLSFILISPFLLLPPGYLLLLSALILVVTPVTRSYFGPITAFDPPYWVIALFGKSYTNWPLFPWFAVFAYGYLVAEYRIRFAKGVVAQSIFLSINLLMLIVGGAFGIFTYFSKLRLWGNSAFSLPVPFIIALLGGYGLFLSFFEYLLPKNPKLGKAMHFILDPFSYGSFWIFLVHVIVGYRGALWFYSLGLGNWRFPLFMLPLLLGSWVLGRMVIFLNTKSLRLILVKSSLSEPEPQS